MHRHSSFIALAIFLILVPGSALAASPSDVLFVEVAADPNGGDGIGEPAGEYFVLFNTTGSPVDLNGWTVTDNGTTAIDLSGTLMPGQMVVVVADAAVLGTDAGTYNCTGWTPKNIQPPVWFSNGLANGSDNLILLDELTNMIDALSYGNDTSVFNPAAPDIFANNGRTLQRVEFPAGPYTDTDTGGDWQGSFFAGSPCEVPVPVVLMSFEIE